MSNYKKFFAELAATVLAAIMPAIAGDGEFSTAEKINTLIIALGAVGVLGAGNLPEGVWKWMKGYVAAATAVAVVASSAFTDGFTTAEIIQMVLAALATAGVVGLDGPKVVEAIGRHRAGGL